MASAIWEALLIPSTVVQHWWWKWCCLAKDAVSVYLQTECPPLLCKCLLQGPCYRGTWLLWSCRCCQSGGPCLLAASCPALAALRWAEPFPHRAMRKWLAGLSPPGTLVRLLTSQGVLRIKSLFSIHLPLSSMHSKSNLLAPLLVTGVLLLGQACKPYFLFGDIFLCLVFERFLNFSCKCKMCRLFQPVFQTLYHSGCKIYA